MDPFEDVRIGASDVLVFASRSCFSSRNPTSNSTDRPLGLLIDFIERAKEASKRTGRADYADGVARSYRLLYGLQISRADKVELLEELVHDLETKVKIATKDLAQAVFEAPVHASFAALK